MQTRVHYLAQDLEEVFMLMAKQRNADVIDGGGRRWMS
jgi:hypothetical protein